MTNWLFPQTRCLDLTGYDLIEGELSFDDYHRINEYVNDIYDNSAAFLQTMSIEYAYPDKDMLEFQIYDAT